MPGPSSPDTRRAWGGLPPGRGGGRGAGWGPAPPGGFPRGGAAGPPNGGGKSPAAGPSDESTAGGVVTRYGQFAAPPASAVGSAFAVGRATTPASPGGPATMKTAAARHDAERRKNIVCAD